MVVRSDDPAAKKKLPKTNLNISASLLTIVLLDLSAIPILAVVQQLSSQLSSFTLPVVGVAVCLGVVYVSSKVLPKCNDPWFYFFVLCSFTCVIDLLLALESLGVTHGMFDLWLKLAESYLDTKWGVSINLVDATLHYALYLTMMKKQLEKKNYDQIGMFWCGSILNSMAVLIGSALYGAYEENHEIKIGFLLNLPYAILPLIFFIQQQFNSPPEEQSQSTATFTPRLMSFACIFLTGMVGILGIPLLSANYQCTNIFARTQYYVGIGFAITMINFQTDARVNSKVIFFMVGQCIHAVISHFLHCAVL